MGTRSNGLGLAVATVTLLGAACSAAAILASAVVSPVARPEPWPSAVGDIPERFLKAYRAAATTHALGADGWAYLAAIGKVESDHGRSTAPGVSSGQNAHGCCSGPMQLHNGFGSGGGTWGAYKTDGDADGRLSIYDVDDAAATAARYLRTSGAPGDWHSALLAYNHAEWYVRRVTDLAAGYRQAAWERHVAGDVPAGTWLSPVPGSPGESCDARIVADVDYLIRLYGLVLTDCFGAGPHATAGEHPLGLAADLVPIDGNWTRTERLARHSGWREDCSPAGCPGRGPFRVVLYNGYPGHGDPRHSRRPHLHLSWAHGPARPFAPAPWVRTLLPLSAMDPR